MEDWIDMKLRPAGYAWLNLTIYVVVTDVFLVIQEARGKENYYTMSSAFRYALMHPVKRWPIILIWFMVTFHLFDFFFPEKVRRFEPLGMAGRLVAPFFEFKPGDPGVEQRNDCF
jgi:hypothetical protein